MNKTYQQKSGEIKRNWHLVDLQGKTLGRAATAIARLLIGKDKPTYTPHLDAGDFVVVINSDQLVLTGKKLGQKLYQHHSGYPGGFKQRSVKEQMARDSRKVVEHAVKGMVPKNKLADPRLRRLKVYKGSEHPHGNHF
jgi:large subunit ribosomal protein L13